jgi:hypothetical protein
MMLSQAGLGTNPDAGLPLGEIYCESKHMLQDG